LADHNKIVVNEEKEILVTMGAGHGFMISMQAVVCQGDEVITPNPSFPLNFGASIVCGAKPISIRLRNDRSAPLDIAGLKRKVTRKTKMIILVTPENPTGIVYPKSVLEEIAEIARQNNIVVLSDEAYENLVFDNPKATSIGSLKGMKDLTLSLFSFSKDYDLSGFRIGYIAAGESLLHQVYKVQRNDGACASVISQVAALAALNGSQRYLGDWHKELDLKRKFLVEALNQIDRVMCPLPGGGCYVFADVSQIGNEQEICNYIASKAKVAVTPGTWYGSFGKGHIRICYGAVDMGKLMEAADRIKNALKSYGA
jgi:aspartate/methionine/tyrosine aminotransferase